MGIDPTPVIFDIGSFTARAGFAGQSEPAVVSSYAQNSSKRVLNQGQIEDWIAMEELLVCTYGQLGVLPTQHPLVFIVPPGLQPKHLQQLCQLLFEKLEVPTLCLGDSMVLSACCSGVTSGIVLDSGERYTRACVVKEGKAVAGSLVTSEFGGGDVTQTLSRFLTDSSLDAVPYRFMNTMKEELCYVAQDPLEEVAKVESYHLPDGKALLVGPERYRACELLFRPKNFVGRHVPGFQDVVLESLQSVPPESHCMLYPKVILSGGNTSFAGLPRRLENEICALAPPGQVVKVVPCCDRPSLAAWRGGAMLAATTSLPWRRREEYLESDVHNVVVTHQKKLSPAPPPRTTIADRVALTHCRAAQVMTAQLQQVEIDSLEHQLRREEQARREAEAAAEELRDRLAATVIDAGRWVPRIERFLRYYDPQCVECTEHLLSERRYRHHPERLLEELIDLYGPEPGVEELQSLVRPTPFFKPEPDIPDRPLTVAELMELRERQPRVSLVRWLSLRPNQPSGMHCKELPPQYPELGEAMMHNVVVSEVDPGSPAALACLEVGDVVISVDGERVSSLNDLQRVRKDFYARCQLLRDPHESSDLCVRVETFDKLRDWRRRAQHRVAGAEALLSVLQARGTDRGKSSELRSMVGIGSNPGIAWPVKPVSGSEGSPKKADGKKEKGDKGKEKGDKGKQKKGKDDGKKKPSEKKKKKKDDE